MTRHLLTTLEGDDQLEGFSRFGIMGKNDFRPSASNLRVGILPGEPKPLPSTTQTPQSAPKSNLLFWIAALGVGLHLLTRKA